MSNIKYGLISETDSKVLEKTIDLVHKEYGDGFTYILEVGCYGGDTASGLRQYVESNGGKAFITGIDNNKDGEPLRFQYDKFISGNSTEVYNQIPDNSQHLVFIDGDHSYIGVISDFYAYKDKVKVGGFLCFHDSGTHIKPFTDFQHGDKEDPDAYISVRKALVKIGLIKEFEDTNDTMYAPPILYRHWMLIFDEFDPNNNAGGICCFRRLH